ncbi:hypothetical protein MMC27_007324 [Xylographa pallens]|nr:hypothetical protein [Xylographa pallens]
MSNVGQPITDPCLYDTPCNTVWLLQRGLRITPGQYEQFKLDILLRLKTLGIAGKNFTAPAVKRKKDQAVKEMIASHTNLSSEIPRDWSKSALEWLVVWVNKAQRRLLRQHSSNVRIRKSEEDTDDNQDTKIKWKKLKSLLSFANQDITSRIQAGFNIRVYWIELQETVECSVADVLKDEVNYTENLWKQLEFRKLLKTFGLLFFREINVEEYRVVWGADETFLEGDVDFAAAMTAQWASDSTNAMFTIKNRQAAPTPLVTGRNRSDTKQQSHQRKAMPHNEENPNATMITISAAEQEKRMIHILKPSQSQQDLGPETPQNCPFGFIDLTSNNEDSPPRVSKRTLPNTRANSKMARSLRDLEDPEVNENSPLLAPRRRIRRVRPRMEEESDDDKNFYALRAAVPLSRSQDLSDTSMEDPTNSPDASDYEPPAEPRTRNTPTPDPTPKTEDTSEGHSDTIVCHSLLTPKPARPRRTKAHYRTPSVASRRPASSRARPQRSLVKTSSSPLPLSRPVIPSPPPRPKVLSSSTLPRTPLLPTVRQILKGVGQTTGLSRPLTAARPLPLTVPVSPLQARLRKSTDHQHQHRLHPRAPAPAPIPAPAPAPAPASTQEIQHALAQRRPCVEPFVEEALGRNIGKGVAVGEVETGEIGIGAVGMGLSFEEFLRRR